MHCLGTGATSYTVFDFKWYFSPDHVHYMAIVAALFKETKQALIASGAEIISEQRADGRFAIAYRVGRTTGRIYSDWQKLSDSGTDNSLSLSLQERLSIWSERDQWGLPLFSAA